MGVQLSLGCRARFACRHNGPWGPRSPSNAMITTLQKLGASLRALRSFTNREFRFRRLRSSTGSMRSLRHLKKRLQMLVLPSKSRVEQGSLIVRKSRGPCCFCVSKHGCAPSPDRRPSPFPTWSPKWLGHWDGNRHRPPAPGLCGNDGPTWMPC